MEKKSHHDLIPVPYRTAKAFEPAIYRNVAYDVYMNDHFKKYFDRNLTKQHQHIPFMTHNRLIERFGKASRREICSLQETFLLLRCENAFARFVFESSRLSTRDRLCSSLRLSLSLSRHSLLQVTLSNSEELFAYYVGEDAETNMHNVYLVKFGSM